MTRAAASATPSALAASPARGRRIAGRAGTTSRTRRRAPDGARVWARGLERRRPGLVDFVIAELGGLYGTPVPHRRLDPIAELVLTILAQNTADINAERAFEALRVAYPSSGPSFAHRAVGPDGTERPPEGWGGVGLATAALPDWAAVEEAPLPELIEVIRPGGLGPQKAPRIQAALRRIRERAGRHDLDFLASMAPVEARDWLTSIDGIGRKTASIVLLFCFGMPLMPVDTHVERVSRRIGLVPPEAGPDDQHAIYGWLLAPDQFYGMHVLLIQHGRRTCDARRPACERCPIAPRCRYVDRRAP